MIDHSFIFITAILTLAFSIYLFDARIFLIQLVIFLGFYLIGTSANNILYLIFSALQLVLGIVALFRCKAAIDYNYQLVLEKTHRVPRNHTKNGNLRGEFSFFTKPY